MSATVTTRTISAVNDNTVVMLNSVWGRAINLPGGWNSMRIGMRAQFTNVSGSIGSTPRFAIGLCHNTVNMVGDATTDNFVGAITNGATWSWNGPGAGSVLFSDPLVPATRVGSTLTTGTQFTGDFRYGANTAAGAFRMGFYLDITRGSPNFTLQAHGTLGFPGTAGDLSSNDFYNSMTAASGSLIVTTPGGIASDSPTETIAVNEGLNGTLNTLSVWWNNAVSPLEISDITFAVLS